MNAADVATALGGRKAGSGFVCRCPAHEDARPSLTLHDGDGGRLLWNCKAGCTQDAVRDALVERGLLNGAERELGANFAIKGRAPSTVWTYRDASGAELLKVARYETPQGKEYRPWRPDGDRWICKALPEPRPLYGLDVLARNPNVPVLVVEGEKCADAARELIGRRFLIVTWPGGAKAAPKADWSPLRGRKVTLWPDADKPGRDAAAAIVGRLQGIAASVAVLEVGERPAGWDVADAIAEGWDADTLLTFIDEHAKPAGEATDTESADELEFTFADELPEAGDEADELVERLLARGAMSVLYGDSNSGKTFVAIDIGTSITLAKPWMGRNVEPGLVVYLAVESPSSVRRRLRAYQKHHGVRVPHFAIVRSPISLFDGDADTERVIALIRKLERRTGRKCELVIGDTLSRLSAGANENSAEDMSIVVRHADRIRLECVVHFLLIHHCGKDLARGMRGWSGLRAATDTEIEVTVSEDGGHALEVTKQRDIDGKGDRIGFRLQVVELGIGKWGKPITSCVVLDADAPAKQTAKRPSAIEGAIVEFLTTRGSGIRKGALVDHFDGRYPASSVYREVKKMTDSGTLSQAVGIVALVRP